VRSRSLRAVGGALALSAAVMITTSAGAFAAEPPDGIVWDHTFTAPGVKVYVEEHGDYISVCDTAKNGHAAWVVVSFGYAKYKLTASNGVGSCELTSAADDDLPEHVEILLTFDGMGHDTDHPDEVASFVNDH
jgi:hypothetical protein